MIQVAPDIMDDFHIFGLIANKMVSYVEIMSPQTFIKLEDINNMWQLIHFKTIQENP